MGSLAGCLAKTRRFMDEGDVDSIKSTYEALIADGMADSEAVARALQMVTDDIGTVRQSVERQVTESGRSLPKASSAIIDRVVEAVQSGEAAQIVKQVAEAVANSTKETSSTPKETAQTGAPVATSRPAPARTEAQVRAAFDKVLASKAKRSDWASEVGVDQSQLDGLIAEALKDGRLKKTKAGAIVRTAKAKEAGQATGQEAKPGAATTAAMTGQTTGQVAIDRPTEVRANAAKNDVARRYALEIAEAPNTEAVTGIIDRLKAEKKGTHPALSEIVKILTGRASKAKTKAATLAEIESAAAKRLARTPAPTPAITTEASGQTSLVPEVTDKDRLKVAAAKALKGGNAPADFGLFGSSSQQLDLVEMSQASAKESATAAVKREPKPVSLIAFLRARGGINGDGGDLRAMEAHKRPGLVNYRNGLTLDHAREIAAEAGYLKESTQGLAQTSTADLLEAIREELSGRPTYSTADSRRVADMRDEIAAEIADAQRSNYVDQLSAWHEENGLSFRMSDREIDRAAILMSEGQDIESAVEAAFIEAVEDEIQPGTASEGGRTVAEESLIRSFDDGAIATGGDGAEGGRVRSAGGQATPEAEGVGASAADRNPDLERDWRDGPPQDGLGQADVPAAAGRDGEGAGAGGEGAIPQGPADRGVSVSDGDASALGAGGDRAVQGGASGDAGRAAGRRERAGSGDAGELGVPSGRAPAEAVGKTAASASPIVQAIEAQRVADATVPFVANDPENIRASLPLLKPAQRDDVVKAEARYAKLDGFGFLFTNGTGTGKTFTGLGVIKRFVKQGKGNVLILAPSQGILDGWVTSGRMIGLDITRLPDTGTAGEGVVATTYANLRENQALVTRQWDLLVADEAHHLSQNASGAPSEALSAFRGLTNHSPAMRASLTLKPFLDEITKAEDGNKAFDTNQFGDTRAMREDYARQHTELVDRFRTEARSKALFLSATPFAYRKNTDWAEGFLFSYPETKGRYNDPGGQAEFMVRNFGYNMRYNRAEEPGPEVNVGVLEREFYERLKRDGVLSGRRLEVEADYDRRFVLVDDAVGAKIDQAMNWLSTEANGRYYPLAEKFREKFNYLAQRRLLEAIKAKHAIPRIKEDLALGRKVVVFHDYNEGGGLDAFAAPDNPNERVRAPYGEQAPTIGELYHEFVRANPYVKKLNFAQFNSPIVTLTAAFPDAMVYNGRVPNKQRARARDEFNRDGSGRDIIIVQSAAGEAGISLHDTTGKHQRVLYNLGLPTRPTTAIQQEGRIYREGQVSDAILRYMSTGTGWERTAFAQTIAERASTAENLALGDEARALRDSFIDAFNEADEIKPNADEGKGGKQRDRTMGGSVTPWERAKAFYFAEGKKGGRRDQREGVDYFATPEPIGLKMVEFADAQIGERILEPSAGHGAIARWFPEGANRFVIEPSASLASRAGLASPGAKVISGRFEDHYVGNKYDAIVMNPPFGHGGKDAFDHVQKAVSHLRDGGRVVAIVPRGGMADRRLDAFRDSDANKNIYTAMEIELPTVMFERAGTKVATRMIVLEKHASPDNAPTTLYRDLSNAETINELFDRIEDLSLRSRVRAGEAAQRSPVVLPATPRPEAIAPVPAPGAASPAAEPAPAVAAAAETRTPANTAGPSVKFKLAEAVHGKTGKDLFVASITQFVPRPTYEALRDIAKKHGGYYSTFRGSGAIPGFQFSSESNRTAFLKETTTPPEAASTANPETAEGRVTPALPDSEAQRAVDDLIERKNGGPLHALGGLIPSREERRLRNYRGPNTKTQDDLPGRISSLWRKPPTSGTFQLFHATNADFQRFDAGMSQDFGVHFGTAEQAGNRIVQSRRPDRARTIPVEVAVKNAITLPDLGYWGPREVAVALRDAGYDVPVEASQVLSEFGNEIDRLEGMGSAVRPRLRRTVQNANKVIANVLNGLGIDGIWYRNDIEGAGWSLLVWNEGQVVNTLTGERMMALDGDVITEDRARRAVLSALKMGRAVTLSKSVLEDMRSAMKRMPDILPAGTLGGFITKVAPNPKGSPKPFKAWFDLDDGSTVSFDGSLDSFLGNGAAFLPTRKGNLVLHFRYAPVGPDGFPTLAGRRWHEAIHALYAAKMFDPATWGLLLSHANSIGVLDISTDSYLRAIGEAGTGNPSVTVRQDYEKAYSGRMSGAQLQDVMDQEAVAIMTELLVMGADLPLPDSIKAILARIETGEMARGEKATGSSDVEAALSAIFSPQSFERRDLARHFGATRIEDIGPSDPHPGRVLAFHGTDRDLEGGRFDVAFSSDIGIHFGTAPQANARTDEAVGVDEGGRVFPSLLDLRNPLTLPDLHTWKPMAIARAIEGHVPELAGLSDEIEDSPAADDIIRQRLTDAGFDGIRYRNETEGSGWSYIVWEPGHVISATSGETLFAIGGYKTEPRKGDRNAHVVMRRLADKSGKPFLARVIENGDDITVEMYDDKFPGVPEEKISKGASRLGRKLGYVDLNYMGVGHFATHGHRGPLYEVGMVQVEQDQRMRGLAKAAYNMIEDMLGTQMLPSGTLLPPGYEIWKRRSPDLVRGHQFHRDDEMYYSPKKIKEGLDAYEKELRNFNMDALVERTLQFSRREFESTVTAMMRVGVPEGITRHGTRAELIEALESPDIKPLEMSVHNGYWEALLRDKRFDRVADAILHARSATTDAADAERLAKNSYNTLRNEVKILRGMWRKVPQDLRSERARQMMFALGGGIAATADQDALARAQEMDANAPDKATDPGAYEAHRTAIWNETGWYRGVDGKWRFEIDDSRAAMNYGGDVTSELFGREGRLADIFTHKPLYAAYPDAGHIAGDIGSLRNGTYYVPPSKGKEAITVSATQAERVPSTLHEVQHAIQDREGFGKGSSTEGLKKELSGKIPESQLTDEVLFEAYRRHAGEVEARAVEARAKMTPEERRARPPWLDYDVPESEQIVVFRNDGVQESAAPGMVRSTFPSGLESKVDRVGSSEMYYSRVRDTESEVYIESIETKRDQGQGNARKLLEDIAARADAEGITLVLDAAPQDDATDATKLRAFYESVGFRHAPGEDKSATYLMKREPKPTPAVPNDGSRNPTPPSVANPAPAANEEGSAPSLNAVIQKLKDSVGAIPTQTLMGVTIKAEDGSGVRINPRANVRGQTQAATGAVGVRKSRAIDVIAHEMAHNLEVTIGKEILDFQRNHADAFEKFAPGLTPSEQFADWFSYYILNAGGTEALTPGMQSAFEDIIEANAPEMLEGLHEARAMYQDWLKRSSPEALASDVVSTYAGNSWSKIAEGDRSLSETVAGKLAGAYTAIIDDLAPVQQTVRRLLDVADANGVKDASGRPISLAVAENPYKIARMFRGSYATGYSWLKNGIANRGETTISFPGLAKALETLFGTADQKSWDQGMYQAAGNYLIAQRAVAEYDRLDQKAARLADIDTIMQRGEIARQRTAAERDKANATLERRQAALLRAEALTRDRSNALTAAEADVRRMQERIQDKKDDVLAAQMARDGALASRRQRELADLERRSQAALGAAASIRDEYDTLSTEVALLNAELPQRREAATLADRRVATIDKAVTDLARERKMTAERGASRPPTKESRDHWLDVIAKTEADPKFARIKEFAQIVHEFSHGLLTLRKQAGFISDDLYVELTKRKDTYVPFQRDMSDASPQTVFGGGVKKWSPFKKFDGSDRAIINPLETLASDAYATAQQIAFNDSVGALASLAERAGPGAASIAHVLTREEAAEANAATFDRIRDVALSMGIDAADADRIVHQIEANFSGEQLSLTWSPATKGPVSQPQVPLYRNGERTYVRFADPAFGTEVMNALSGMGKETASWLTEFFATPSRVLQMGITTHPTFMPRNLFRDIFDAWIKTGALPIVTQVKGARVMRDDAFMRRYYEAGGIVGGRNVAALTSQEQQTKVLDLGTNRISRGSIMIGAVGGGLLGTLYGGPIGGIAGALAGGYLLRRGEVLKAVEAAETMTRVGVASYAYKRALAHNPNLSESEAMLEAAFVARDVFDWNRRGSKMVGVVRAVTFLNAQVQGLDAAFRNLVGASDRGNMLSKHLGMVWRRENGGNLSAEEERALGNAYKTWARMGIYTMGLLSLYALATSGDDDDDKRYQDVRDKTKATHSWLPNVFGVDIRLPKAFEWAMPANVIEAIADKIRGRDPRLWDRVVDSTYEVMAPPIVPQAASLIVGISTNAQLENLAPWVKRLLGRDPENVNNRQVVGDQLARLDPEAQFDAFTTQLSIDVAKGMAAAGIPRDMVPSPKKIDFILRSGGYWGQDIAKGYGIMREGLGYRPREAPRVSDIPVVAGFTGVTARQSKSRDELFQQMAQSGGMMATAAATYKQLIDEEGTPADAERFLSRLNPEERAYTILKYYGTPSDVKDHPMERLLSVDRVLSKIRKDMILDRLTEVRKEGRKTVRDFETKIELSPRKQTEVHDIVERLQQAEAWNTMVLMKRPGWEGKGELAVKPIMDELKASHPKVFELYEDRLQATRAREFADVKRDWPELRQRVLRDGKDAF